MVQPNKKQSNAKLQWHPAFCAAAELELRSEKMCKFKMKLAVFFVDTM